MKQVLWLIGTWQWNFEYILNTFSRTLNILCEFASVNSIVIFSSAQSQIEVDKLFHANPPSLSSNRPVNAQSPQSNQNADRPNDDISEVFDGDFKLFRGPRHDEFDWSLTKVSIIYRNLIRIFWRAKNFLTSNLCIFFHKMFFRKF